MNELTISFSGYNIKEYLQLAIKSFLYFHPEYKECIVVFDDNSTDGTKEWLKEYGIKRITWSGKYDDIIENITLRINLIYREIFEQCNSKYLLNLDGDIIFLDTFLYNLLYNIKQYDIIGYIDYCGNIINKKAIYNLYKHLIYKDFFLRIWPGFMILNLFKFKSYDILFDNIYNNAYNTKLQSGIDFCFDSGVDMYMNILKNNFKVYSLTTNPNNFYYHFCGKSVLSRSIDLNKTSWQYGKHNQIPQNIQSTMNFFNNINNI